MKEAYGPSVPVPICLMCRHYDQVPARHGCFAFPNGIPWPILLSHHDHRLPFLGDAGRRFEAVDEAAARYASELFSRLEGEEHLLLG